jgi:ABC-type antimicrobial peptide transport system permease subunit
MSYAVTQRTREIGIRIAIGASKTQVLVMVLGRGLTLIGAGLVIGIIVGLATSRGIAGLLFGVQPTDPWIFAAVAGLMILTGMAAAYVPARRAVRIDPMQALREE